MHKAGNFLLLSGRASMHASRAPINHRKTAISAKGENTSPTVPSATATALLVTRTYYGPTRGVLCVRPVVPQDRLSAYGVEKRARAHIQIVTDTHVRACLCVCRGRWKGTGWLEGLYRFVDETTVIRHCVWPHPRLCPRFMDTPLLPPPLARALLRPLTPSPLAYRSPCYQFRSAVWLVTTGSVVAAMLVQRTVSGWPTGLAI